MTRTIAMGYFFFQSRRVSFNFETSPKAINEILLGVDQGPYLFPFDDNNLILVHVAFKPGFNPLKTHQTTKTFLSMNYRITHNFKKSAF
jgi:hypothetical protein